VLLCRNSVVKVRDIIKYLCGRRNIKAILVGRLCSTKFAVEGISEGLAMEVKLWHQGDSVEPGYSVLIF